MSCTVRFGNRFLRVPLMYQPCCLVPCCQGKLGELTKTVYKTYSTVYFVTWYHLCKYLGEVAPGLDLARHEGRRGLQLAVEDLEGDLLVGHDDGHVRLRVRLRLDDLARAVLEVQVILADSINVEEEGGTDLFDDLLVADGLDALEHLPSSAKLRMACSTGSRDKSDLGNVLVDGRGPGGVVANSLESVGVEVS